VAVLNLGTGGQISVPSRRYVTIPGMETRPAAEGGWLLVGASLCGGWSYAYLNSFFRTVARELCGREPSAGTAYAVMNRWAAQAPAGAEGLTADTRFSGTRLEPQRRGSLTGMDRTNLTPANVTRAVLEGMVAELLEFTRHPGVPRVRRIVAAGNAVRKNPALRTIIADLAGVPCTVSCLEEAAAFGAAVIGWPAARQGPA